MWPDSRSGMGGASGGSCQNPPTFSFSGEPMRDQVSKNSIQFNYNSNCKTNVWVSSA
jgi:hypothetical protein